MSRGNGYEQRIIRTVLLAVVPLIVIALTLAWKGHVGGKVRWTIVAVVIVCLFLVTVGLHDHIVYPVRTVASLLGAVSGAVLALVLTWVVNPAFFGWTIHLHVPWLSLAAMPLWMVASTIVAAWLPARRAADAAIAEAIREE